MAERFIIDGNFTQSFDHINLMMDACPEGIGPLPTVHYQIGSGDLCYDLDDRICFDLEFNLSNELKFYSESSNWIGPLANEGTFQFVGTRIPPYPGEETEEPFFPAISESLGIPTSSISQTHYVLFNTASSTANVGLTDYLTRNKASGSIVMSSLRHKVEFEYHTHLYRFDNVTSSYENQVILGQENASASAEFSTLRVIAATKDDPFSNGDRICLEIRPKADTPPLQHVMEVGPSSSIAISSSAEVALSGSGDIIINNITASNISASGDLFASLSFNSEPNVVVYNTESGQFYFTSSTELGSVTSYQTGSADPLNLDLLTIIDYDENVFVTASGDNLILQFGIPPSPTILSFDDTPNPFATNRFDLTVDSYDLTLTYDLNGTTFVSASFTQGNSGSTSPGTLVTESLDSDGTIVIPFNAGTNLTQFRSGSQHYIAHLHVTRIDGSPDVVTASLDLNLSKTNPSDPSLNLTLTIEKNAFVNNDPEFEIEEGATGSIDVKLTSGNDGGGTEPWQSVSPQFSDGLNAATVTVAVNTDNTVYVTSSTTATNKFEQYWISDPYSNTTYEYTGSVDRTYSRVRSLRYGTTTNTSFISSEADLRNITDWVDNVGTIQFGENSEEELNGLEFNISASATGEYVYIVYDNNISTQPTLTNITGNQVDIDNGVSTVYTAYTVGNYKVWRTNIFKAGELTYRLDF